MEHNDNKLDHRDETRKCTVEIVSGRASRIVFTVEAGSKPRTGVAESNPTPYSTVDAHAGCSNTGASDIPPIKMTVEGVEVMSDSRSERLTDGDEGNWGGNSP